MIIDCPLLPARPHDSQLLDDLVAGHEGVVPANKAFVDHFRQENLALKRHIELVAPAEHAGTAAYGHPQSVWPLA